MISAVSDWNSRTIWSGEALLRSPSERNDLMRYRPGLEVPVLQMPQPGIDVAALEQLLMRADVVHGAAFEHDDRVRRNQSGETVRDDNQGAPLRDAQQVGVDDGFAVGVERTGRLVEHQNTRVADQRPS